MLRSLYILLVYLSFIGMGAVAPFVLSLGYIWVSVFRPQQIAYILLPSIPVSMIMGALAFGAYLLMDRRAPPRLNLTLILTLLWGGWITLTTIFLAVAPEPAWEKWDWAVKNVLFSAFIPFVIRSRVQIEAFLQVYLFGLAIHILPTGLKTMISGGGYGRELGLVGGNTGFGEGSTLATASIMMIPVIIWLMKYNVLMPRMKLVRLMYMGLAVVALACTVGTYSRTGLIGMVVVGGVMWFRSQQKVLFSLVILAGMALVSLMLGFAADLVARGKGQVAVEGGVLDALGGNRRGVLLKTPDDGPSGGLELGSERFREAAFDKVVHRLFRSRVAPLGRPHRLADDGLGFVLAVRQVGAVARESGDDLGQSLLERLQREVAGVVVGFGEAPEFVGEAHQLTCEARLHHQQLGVVNLVFKGFDLT